MKYFDFSDYESTTTDRSEYMARYHKSRYVSRRKKPIMTAEERREAKRKADHKYNVKRREKAISQAANAVRTTAER